MAQRKIGSSELAAAVGITPANISKLKNGKVHGIRFSTLEALCQVLRCKPGDIIDYVTPEEAEREFALGSIVEKNY